MHQKPHTSPVKLFWKRLTVITLGCFLSLLSLEANAYWDPPIRLTPTNPWVANFTQNPTLIYADPQGQVANYGIGIDFATGQAHISYFDWTNGDLKVAVGCP